MIIITPAGTTVAGTMILVKSLLDDPVVVGTVATVATVDAVVVVVVVSTLHVIWSLFS